MSISLDSMDVGQLEALIKAASAKLKAKEEEIAKLYQNSDLIETVTALGIAKLPQVTQVQLGISTNHAPHYPKIDPKCMPSPAVRGIDILGRPFIAVRCAPLKDYKLESAKVEFVWQRYSNNVLASNYRNSLDILQSTENMNRPAFEKLAQLLQNKPITSSSASDPKDAQWKLI